MFFLVLENKLKFQIETVYLLLKLTLVVKFPRHFEKQHHYAT